MKSDFGGLWETVEPAGDSLEEEREKKKRQGKMVKTQAMVVSLR